jgi:hypothetical protein
MTDPTERFSDPTNYEDEVFEPNPVVIGEGALRATAHEILGGKTLYEAAFDPDTADEHDVQTAIDDMAEFARTEGLLHDIEAESLRRRLRGMDPIELPDQYVSGKGSTANLLLGLIRDYPGQMNREADKDRRRHAQAMKNLMQKFIRDDMSISEIQDWIGAISGQQNMYGHIKPEHVPVVLAGAFDALLREAATLPSSRLQIRVTARLDRFDPAS